MITPLFLALVGGASANPSESTEATEATEPTEATEGLPADHGQADAEQLRREMEALRREVEELRASADRAAADDRSAGSFLGARAAERPNPSRTGFGEAVRVEVGEEVDEIVSFGDDVEIAGHVLGDAVSFGGNVVVHRTGLVGGDAVSFGGRVLVEDGGAIEGDRVAMSMPPTPVSPIEPTAPIGVGSLAPTSSGPELLHGLYRKLVWLMSVAGAGVLVVGLFPQRVSRVAKDLGHRPVRAAVVGSLATGFLLLFSLLFTIVTLGLGLPVGLLLVGVLGIAWLFGFVGLCQAVGDRLPFEDRPHGRWLAFLVGVLLVTFLGSLPWVGWLVVGSASVLGIGSALSTRFGKA